MTMKLYRPTPDGGLEPAPVEAKDHRRRLRSRRWGAAELANPKHSLPMAIWTGRQAR